VAAKFKADSPLLTTLDYGPSRIGKEYNTFRKMQNKTDMNFNNLEDEGCSKK